MRPHSSDTNANTRSVSEAATYLSQPWPAPSPNRPPEAMHIMELISKLETLASRNDAGALRRQVVVSGRVKTMNESIYYNVDRIHEAIAHNLQITFRYFEWDFGGERRFRPGLYTASPYALIWDDQNYYLVAHSQRHGLTHYRVDKMSRITETGQPRFMASGMPRPLQILSVSVSIS